MNIGILSSIVRGAWAIDPRAIDAYAPIINNMFSAVKAEFERVESKTVQFAHVIAGNNYEEPTTDNLAIEFTDEIGNKYSNNIAILNMRGPLTKYDQECGPKGMLSMIDYVKKFTADGNIKAIVLRIDSPGGQVDGTEQLADAIAEARTKKPVIAYVDDLMASAALWIGVQANEIYANTETAEIGSVGVMLSFMDVQPAYEKMGVKFHSIVADQSSDKNKMFEELRAGNYDNYKKEILNPLADKFIGVVKKSRKKVDKEHLTGKVFFARDVEGVFTDGVKTFDQVIMRALELAKSNNLNTDMKKFENLNTAAGAELEVADGGVFLQEEIAANIDAQLGTLATVTSERDAALADLEAARASVASEREQAVSEVSAQLTTANETIAQLTAEVADLRKKPGAESATIVSTKETGASASEEDKDLVVTGNESLPERIAKVAQAHNL